MGNSSLDILLNRKNAPVEDNIVRTLRQRLIHGTKWSLIGAAISQGLGLLASIMVAKFIHAEGFGKYGIIQSTVAMFGVFAGMAMGITTTKHVAEFRTQDPARAGRYIGLPIMMTLTSSVFVSILLVIFSEPVAKYILAEPSLTNMIWISSPLLLLNALNSVQMAALAGLEAFKVLAIASTVTGVATFPCVFVGVWQWGLPGALGGLVVSRIVTYVVLQAYLQSQCRKQGIKLSYRGLRTEWPTIWGFSLPTLLAGTILGPAGWLCNVLLVNFGGGYPQMGIYNATLQWQNAVRFVPLQILAVTLPVLSNLYGTRDFARYYRLIRLSLLAITAATLAVTIPLMIFGKLIMTAFGKDFTEGFSVLNLMLIAAVLHMTARILSQVAQSRGKAKVDLLFCSVLAAVMVGAWLAMLDKGALGLAAATCIGYLVMNAGLGIYVLGVRNKDKKAAAGSLTAPASAENNEQSAAQADICL